MSHFASQNPELFEHFSLLARELLMDASRLQEHSVNPRPTTQDVLSRIAYDFEKGGWSIGELLSRFTRDMGDSLLRVDHPMYFGVFNPNPVFAGVIAEALVSQFNPQLASSTSARFAIECEKKLLRYFGEKAGFTVEQIDGTFCSGGTEANLTSVLCALHRRHPEFYRTGLAGTIERPAIYVSVETHHSLKKAIRILGLGLDALRVVEVDETLRFSVEALDKKLQDDLREGFKPILIVGTLGSTSGGVIDDLKALGELARKYGADFHVDAAWGGGALLLPELQNEITGVELADSIAIDAHKWFAVPMTAGLFISRHPGVLNGVFDIGESPYMPPESFQAVQGEPFQDSMAWSRRFSGLKLLFAFLVLGETGYQKLFRHSMKLGDHFRGLLQGNEAWKFESDATLPVVCFRPTKLSAKKDLEAFAARINDSGKAWITTTSLGNRAQAALRVGFPNFETRHEDVDRLFALLEAELKKLHLF